MRRHRALTLTQTAVTGLCLAVALSVGTHALAQGRQTGTLRGSVQDSTDAALPGVTVTVRSRALQGTRSAVTELNGSYELLGLPNGNYIVTFELQGFNLGFPICPPRMAPLYTQRQRSARNPCSSQHRPASEAVSSARAAVRPLKSLRSGRSADTAPDVCPFGRQVAAPHGPRVSLPAPAAPKSAAACRRTAAWSDALLPAGASSTGHALRAGPRSSPAAAGDS